MRSILQKLLKVVVLFSIFFPFFSAQAQVPQKMSYQSVVRNTTNALVSNTAVGVKISVLPTQTTTYTLVADELDTEPNHITMNITEMTTGTSPKITEWNSSNTSGILTLVVEGTKVTANLTGIVLKAGTGATGFINGNIGAFASNGTLSGTLTFYKD
jgi:hypothetical protein